jgi:hypothetical protein
VVESVVLGEFDSVCLGLWPVRHLFWGFRRSSLVQFLPRRLGGFGRKGLEPVPVGKEDRLEVLGDDCAFYNYAGVAIVLHARG